MSKYLLTGCQELTLDGMKQMVRGEGLLKNCAGQEGDIKSHEGCENVKRRAKDKAEYGILTAACFKNHRKRK